jgi:GntR family transcriptional regulator
MLQEKLNIIPSEADETLEVTLATMDEADLLQVVEGAPLLLSERVLFAQDRRPVEYVKILYRGDRYQYYVRLTR